MNQLIETSEIPSGVIAGQIASLIHVAFACVVTVLVLKKKKKELRFGVLFTLLVVWFIPLLGPACVVWGLRSGSARQSI